MFVMGLTFALQCSTDYFNHPKRAQVLFEEISDKEKIKSYKIKRPEFYHPLTIPENSRSSSLIDLKF